jgi:hypothetical protein
MMPSIIEEFSEPMPPRRLVLSQQMVSTPVTELDSDIVQKDRRNESDFSI